MGVILVMLRRAPTATISMAVSLSFEINFFDSISSSVSLSISVRYAFRVNALRLIGLRLNEYSGCRLQVE